MGMLLRIALVLASLVGACTTEYIDQSHNPVNQAVCGDGIVEGTEVCDDGNVASGDGCNADCTSIEACGNGIVDVGEQCDDGNAQNGDGCENNCQLSAGG